MGTREDAKLTNNGSRTVRTERGIEPAWPTEFWWCPNTTCGEPSASDPCQFCGEPIERYSVVAEPVSDEMVERALRAFHVGPPGVLRRVQLVDSYPGEHPGDPEAYRSLPTTTCDEKDAVRAVLEAALSFRHATTTNESRADGLAEVLRLADMHITGAWAHIGSAKPWAIRIASDLDADHDTYYTAHGATFTAALAEAVKWTADLGLTKSPQSEDRPTA